MKIGWVGLGIMGSRMADNLVKAGHEVTVHNRTRARAEDLLQAGARWADSLAAVAQGQEVVITMLTTPAVVAEHARQILPAMQPGALWIDSSTVNPAFSREMAQLAQQHGQRFLDAPVAGSKVPAETAQLTFLVGGPSADVEQAQPLFAAMGKATIHAGEHGLGSALKMVFNLLLGVNMLAFAEALSLGEAEGLSREAIFSALGGSIVVPPFALSKRAKIDAADYTADFPLQWMQKDLHLAAQTAAELGLALPATNLSKEIYRLAARSGLAEQDFAAIYAYLTRERQSKA